MFGKHLLCSQLEADPVLLVVLPYDHREHFWARSAHSSITIFVGVHRAGLAERLQEEEAHVAAAMANDDLDERTECPWVHYEVSSR